jgi:hypothetical protein
VSDLKYKVKMYGMNNIKFIHMKVLGPGKIEYIYTEVQFHTYKAPIYKDQTFVLL